MKAGILLLPAACVTTAVGQEALFNNAAHQRLSAQTRSAIESMPYTFRVKDLRVIVTPTLDTEWNDNVHLSDANKESDVLFTPRVDFHAIHPLGERNRLSLDLGLGYTKYISNDELDRMVITPGSTFDFDFGVGDVQFNLHNRLSYDLDPTLVGAVANTGTYGGLENTAGFSALWQLNRISLSAGYDYLLFIADDDDQAYLDRSTHSVWTRAGVEVYPNTIVGAEATGAPTTYDDSYLNDNIAYSLGGYVDWKVTDHFHVVPRGGYSLTTFEANPIPGAIQGEVADYDGFYFGLVVDHRPNEVVSYRLSADRQIKPGVDANLTDTYTANLAMTWSFIRGVPFTTSLLYENGKQTAGGQIGGGVALGGEVESWERYGGTISLGQEITRRLRASVTYGLTYRDSDFADRDYLQNRVTFTLAYRL